MVLIAGQEFFGVAYFMLFACMLTVDTPLNEKTHVDVIVAMSFVFITVTHFAHINPYVSLAGVWLDVLGWDEMLWRWLFQVLGGLGGYLTLIWIIPFPFRSGPVTVCLAKISPKHPFLLQGAVVEFFITYFYMTYYTLVWTEKNKLRVVSLACRVVLVFVLLIFPSVSAK